MEPYTFTDGTYGWTIRESPLVGISVVGPPTRSATIAVARELLRVVEERDLLKLRIGGADRLADEVAALVTRRVLDSRSAAADALLDYREPPRTARSDHIAALEAELTAVRAERDQLVGSFGRERVAALEAENARLRAALSEEACPEFIHNGGVAISRCARCGMGKSAHVRG